MTEFNSAGFFNVFQHLHELTVLDLSYNTLNLEGVGGHFFMSNTVLHNLRQLSLRGNPIGRIEDFLFSGLRESTLTELNLQNCDIR